MQPSTPPAPRYAKSTPQFSSEEMSPSIASNFDAQSMESILKLIEDGSSTPYSPSPDAIPAQERNPHGFIYDMSPSRLSDEERLVQMLTAFHKINFPRR